MEFISADELTSYRKSAKFAKYMPTVSFEDTSKLTKQGRVIADTGLTRKGFTLSGQTLYRYDTVMMEKYFDAILANTIRGMEKQAEKYPDIAEDRANYGQISYEILQTIMDNPTREYNMEGSYSDSRGRAIMVGLKRVFNPIGYKDARALLRFKPIEITVDNIQALDDIYLFIAELVGNKVSSWTAKIEEGMRCYQERVLPELDLTNEDDLKELHEQIWLERIYSQLDTLYTNGVVDWEVIIEQDQTALT